MIKHFPATLDHLYEMLIFIKEQATAVGFTANFVSKIELASEEALVNIISHGYPQTEGTITIQCLNLDGAGIKIIIRDEGIEFDPIAAVKGFDPKSNHEKKMDQVGGYGIYFIINMMDNVDYQRVDEANVLTLVKFVDMAKTVN